MIALISSIITLVILIVREYLRRTSEAAKIKAKYLLTVAEFSAIVSASLIKLQDDARKDSSQAHDVEDQVDNDLQNRGKNP